MPTSIYCTYLTVYTGNKLPPFYIGSTSIDNINKGYRGSVQSKKYQSIWKQEIASHPDLFKTIILTRHETRQEAMEREIVFQEAFTVARNPMYINMAHANGKFFTIGPLAPETIAKMSAAQTGKTKSPEHKANMSAAHTGKIISPDHKAKIAAANIGKKHTPESKAKIAAAKTGQKRSPETKAKIADAQTGKKQSPEHIANNAAARIGKKRGPHKKKLDS